MDHAPSTDRPDDDAARSVRLPFLSTLQSSASDRRHACYLIGASSIGFLLLAPFASVKLVQIDAFIPAYELALAIDDLIIALLLFGQFAVQRRHTLLLLAGGYLFTSLIALAHMLTFPGLFSATGLPNVGSQGTAWLYMAWHAGFPLLVVAYALTDRQPDRASDERAGVAILATIGLTCMSVGGVTWLALAGASWLPPIMAGDGYAPAMTGIVTAVWLLSVAALLALCRRRPYSVLDLWLIVVMSAWLFDVALSALLNSGRFDLGFYAGCIYGLIAASFVLIMLLLRTGALYRRVAEILTAEARANARLDDQVNERTRDLTATQERLEAEIATRRRMHEELDEARTFLHLVIENIPVGVIVKDATTLRFVLVNAVAEKTMGLRREEIIGKNSHQLLPPDMAEKVVARDRAALATTNVTIIPELLIRHAGRPDRHARIRLAPIIGSDDKPKHLIIISENVSELRHVEQQLRQAQKMEAIGQLTGGMAHDFNNLLGIIHGNLDLLIEQCPPNGEVRELAESALQAAQHGAELTRRLLAFARRQPLAPKIVDPNLVLQATIQLLRRTLGESITLEIDIGAESWPISIDVAQLESAILNLAVNARDAMPEGGALTIERRNVVLDDAEAEHNPEATPGEYVMIAVSDTGIGMTPETLAHAFEPFFTAKGSGGTGLGLSMVHGFVRQSGGHTKIYSEPEHGTTVRIYLPRAEQAAFAEPTAPSVAVPLTGNEQILVVEDNKGMRDVAVRQLQSLGYRTIPAVDGPSALAILRGGAPVDLLFTDMVMPGGIDGHALAAAARQVRPALKVLFTSGFTPAAASAVMTDDFGANLLSKPYRLEELARRIRRVLDDI